MHEVESVSVGDVALPVAVSGDPAGPPLVIVPGLSDGLAPLSEPHGRRLLGTPPRSFRRYRVLAVSHRHPLPPDVDTGMLARDLAAVLDARVDRPVVVAAHSMGGMVAQHLAADRPDLVDRLLLSATLARADAAFRAVLDRWQQHLDAGRWRAFYRDAVAASFTGAARRRRLAWLRLAPVPRPGHLVERHRALGHACVTHDARHHLHEIQAPTLIMAGAEDRVVAVSHARALGDAIPEARVEILPDLGHAFPEQAGERFGAIVSLFLQAGHPGE